MTRQFKFWKITLLLFLGLVVFLYLFINTAAEFYVAVTNPAAGLHFHFREDVGRVVIYGVIAGGPADFAGLQKGDEILAVNDQMITSLSDFVHALMKLEIGKLTEIRALRGQTEVRIAFVSERWINTKLIFFSLLPNVLFGYTLCLIGVFVLLNRIHDREAQIFYLMLIFWALAMRETFPQDFTLHNILPLWFQDVFLLPAWPLAVGLLLHFHLIFPVENESFKKRPALFKLLIYSPLILIIPHLYGVLNHLRWAERFLNIGWGTWLSLYFIAALTVLHHWVNHAPNPYMRKQAEIMFKGTALSLGVPFITYFLPTLLFRKSFPYSEFFGLLVILWPLTLAYVIVRHRFMNIQVIIKRGLAYALTSGFVVAAYFLLVVGIGQLVLYLTGSRSQLVIILATLAIAALFNPVKDRVHHFVERSFYPNRFRYRETVRDVGHQLVNVLDLETLLENLLTFFTETLNIRPVTIFWFQPERQIFAARYTIATDRNALPVFTPEDKLIKSLEIKQQLLDLSPLKKHPELISDEEMKKCEALKAEIAIPLVSKGRLVGVLCLGSKTGDEPYFKEDLDWLETLTDRINISIENAFLTEELREQDRLKKELEVARRIQLSSLPQSDPVVPGLEISGVSIPALEVGGDYYDYLTFPDGQFGVVIGDVSGKGTSAALYMSQLKGVLKTASKYHQSLKELLGEVNNVMFKNIELQSFITLTMGVFDLVSRRFRMVRAGHLPLIYYSAKDQSCQELVPAGIGIGLANGKIFKSRLEETSLELAAGDILLFFTDGVLETRSRRGEEFEPAFCLDILRQHGYDSAIELRQRILAQVQTQFGHDSQHDDMTLVVVKVL
jgi:sigma-B regulation protein RsbU (phosphoserine phosphatase)